VEQEGRWGLVVDSRAAVSRREYDDLSLSKTGTTTTKKEPHTLESRRALPAAILCDVHPPDWGTL